MTARARGFHREATKRCSKTAKDGYHSCPHGMLLPSKPLSPGKPIPRSTTRIKARNTKRKGSRFPRRRCPAYKEFVRTFGCHVAGLTMTRPGPKGQVVKQHICYGAVTFAHLFKTVAGGAPDYGQGAPLCMGAHTQGKYCQEHNREAFWQWYGLDRNVVAQHYRRLFDEQHPERHASRDAAINREKLALEYAALPLDQNQPSPGSVPQPTQRRGGNE